MCRVLDVSVNGYYAWCKRLPSQHSREDAQIAEEVHVTFQANRQGYGSPCIHAEWREQGRRWGRKRIAWLMRELQLSAQLPRHRTMTTKSEKGVRVADNVVQRDFHADEPNRKWVTDTTSIWTSEGWLSVAVVLDLFSRLMVGWSMAAIQDATFVEQALQMALARRSPQAGLLHHADRGSISTAESYQAILKQEGLQVSMSRTGKSGIVHLMESRAAFLHDPTTRWCSPTPQACFLDEPDRNLAQYPGA